MLQPVPELLTATAPATVTVKTVQRKAKDFLIFSVVVTLLCFFLGNITSVLFSLPALICSFAVSVLKQHNLMLGGISKLNLS